jgi:hypothetical protein
MRAAALAALLAAAAAAQGAQPFSHRLHTKLMSCRDCHQAMWTSTSLENRLLPGAAVCQKCHKGMTVPSPGTFLVSHFDHARHLRMGNVATSVTRAIDSGTYLFPAGALKGELNAANDCTACHRGLAEQDSPGRSPLARMADCLVCHNRIEPPESCQLCHAADAKPKPASHTADFMDTHTSGKLNLDKSTCAVCHGRRFTCLGCH